MNSRAVKRIGDVMRLRTAQFRQDAGPMAHPIRPESYISMDNFYTVTVYEKGTPLKLLPYVVDVSWSTWDGDGNGDAGANVSDSENA